MTNNSTVARILNKKIRQAIAQGLKTSTLKIWADAKELCPVAPGGGMLRASISCNADMINENNLEGFVWTDVSYAPMVEYNTKAHIIEPKNKKALTIPMAGGRLVWRNTKGKEIRKTKIEAGNKTVITDALLVKKVHHPGTTAQPFLRPSLDKNRDFTIKQIVKEINKI